MKKLLTFFGLAVLLIFASFKLTHAKFATSQGEIRREEIKEKLQDKKEAFEIKKASLEGKVIEKRNERIASYWVKVKKRIFTAIERLNKIISRIETRIAKIDANGGSANTVTPKSEVQKAKNLIIDAQNKVANIDTTLPTALSSNNPKNSFKTLLTNIKAIRKDLKDAHKTLAHIIGSIKGLRVGESKLSGTPSVTQTPTPTATSVPTATLTPTLTVTPTP